MNQEMTIRKIPVSDINPAKYNPRKDLKPGDPVYEKLKRSMSEFGYVEPIIWNKETGNIVGGHQRYKVLVAEGHTEVECVVVKLSPEREKALNVALNKVTGDWEFEALADLLKELDEQDFDVTLTGFDAAEIDDLFSQVHDKDAKDDNYDVNKALEEAAFVQPGDIWLLGRHRLMCGDATKAEKVAQLMDGKKANLVVTDPPYNVDFESSSGLKSKPKWINPEDHSVLGLSDFISGISLRSLENYLSSSNSRCEPCTTKRDNCIYRCTTSNFGYKRSYKYVVQKNYESLEKWEWKGLLYHPFEYKDNYVNLFQPR